MNVLLRRGVLFIQIFKSAPAGSGRLKLRKGRDVMAGGTWKSQNKKQPGVYINTRSQDRVVSNIGTKGVVAIAKPLSWGKTGVIQAIIPGEDLTQYIGYEITSPQAMFLREMMKGSDTTPGPVKVLLYRPKGTGGAAASATSGVLTVTARYEGIRGNDITVMIEKSLETDGSFDVTTVVDGKVVDEQTAATVAGLKANEWVTFSGEGDLAEAAGVPLEDGVDPTVAAADYADFLTELEPYQFDILVYDGDDTTTVQAMAAFVKRISERVGFKCQAVMAGAKSCNSEFVISVRNGVKLTDGTVLTAAQAAWWLGGAEAGALYNDSLTYAQYPDAAEAYPKLSSDQVDEAIKEGEITFIDSYGTVKVCTDINTLTTFTSDKGEEYSKNRVLRVLHQFCNDVHKQFSLYYIGKTDNNENGRNLLKAWIVGYLNEMQANSGIQNFEAEDVTVTPGAAMDAVLIDVAVQPIDSVEKIYMSVSVAITADAE